MLFETPARIDHFEVAVHFECLGASDATYQATPRVQERVNSWSQRIQDLGEHPNIALVYSSYYLQQRDGELVIKPSVRNQQALNDELERINLAQRVFGSRFFLYGPFDYPTKRSLSSVLKARSLTYDPNQAWLLACGEWLKLCVDVWKEKLTEALGLDDNNCGVITKLSSDGSDQASPEVKTKIDALCSVMNKL